MAPSFEKDVCLEAEPPRPSAVLRLMEDQAISVAKFLRHHQQHLVGTGESASVEDALQVADLVANLASKGQKCDAEQVSGILCRCEILLDSLVIRVTNLRTKTR